MLVLALSSLQIWDPPLVEAARLRIFDQLQRFAPRAVPEDSPVVIVDIDDASLAELGQWPWPRTVFADLVTAIGQYGPRAIVFDVLFSEPDRLSPPTYANLIERTDAGAAAILRALPSYDETMAAALRPLAVVLGEAGTFSGQRGTHGINPPARIAWLGDHVRDALPAFPYGVSALPELANAAQGLGFVSILPEVDGIVRRAPTMAVISGRVVPSLPIEAVRIARGEKTLVVRGDERGMVSIAIGGLSVPTDGDGRMWIHYTPRRSELYVSTRSVLAGEIPADRIAGRIVLVGSSAVSLSDVRVTPVAGNTPGVEVQAQLIELILAGDMLLRPAVLIGAEVAVVLFGGLLLAWFGTRLPAASFPPLVAVVVMLAGGVAWYGYAGAGYLVDSTYPAFAFGVLLFWLAMAKYIGEETSRRNLRHAFGHYLSPVMIDRLVGNPAALALEGERKDLTVLFSDVRGFTSLTESYVNDPEGLTKLLNRYFTTMTEEILARDGTIDKYIGDAIMAFWNAPLDDPEHPRHACLAAFGMMRRLAEFNRELADEFAERGEPFVPMRIGIGIATGQCFVGNMGSKQRFNYSVIGDSVNVASRLEASSKTYGFPIIVGEDVRVSCPEFGLLELETVQLRGRQRTTRVFALVGDQAARGHELWPELVASHEPLANALRQGEHGEVVDRLWRRCEGLATELGVRDTYTKELMAPVTIPRAVAQ